MNLDIEIVKQVIGAVSTALAVLKQAKDLLPQSSKKQELTAAIEIAEKQMAKTEIELAKALGHEICTNHWPSGIMLSADKKHWKCPICGNEIKQQKPQSTKHPASGIEIL